MASGEVAGVFAFMSALSTQPFSPSSSCWGQASGWLLGLAPSLPG